MVQGLRIEFQSIPFQKKAQSQCVKQSEMDVAEIEKCLQKGVIVATMHEKGEFISPIFIRPKNDGFFQLILNLKRLNIHVEYQHFKMDTLSSSINMMKPNSYMASVDLKDAYYSVPIAYCDQQKYLKFEWMVQFYKFTRFPNGLAFCPRNLQNY